MIYDGPARFYIAGYELPDVQEFGTSATTIEEARHMADEFLEFTQEVRIYDWPTYETWLDDDYKSKKPDPLFTFLNEVDCEWECCVWFDYDHSPMCDTFVGSRYDAEQRRIEAESAYGANWWIGRVEHANATT